jgi:hypothetical protein
MERKLLNIMRGIKMMKRGKKKGEMSFLLHFREVTMGERGGCGV